VTNILKDYWLIYKNDPDNWIVIPELNILPQDVDFKGFEYQIVEPQSGVMHYRIFEIVKAVRSQASKRFKSLADLSAAYLIFTEKIDLIEDRLVVDEYSAAKIFNFPGCSADELFAFRYTAIFYSIERCFLFYKEDNKASLHSMAKIAVNLAEMMIEKPLHQYSVSETLSKIAKIGGVAKNAIDPKQKDKYLVQECWDDWQKKPDRYKGKAAFARDMREKFPNLESQPVIERWCREWERES